VVVIYINVKMTYPLQNGMGKKENEQWQICGD